MHFYKELNEKKHHYHHEFDYRIVMDDGRIKYICQHCEFEQDSHGNLLILFCIIQDKTEKQLLVHENEQTRQILYKQSRLSELGEAIALVFHQWKEPLAQINALVADLEFACKTDGLSSSVLEEILDEFEQTTHQMSVSIESIRNYVNPQKIRERFDVKQTIDETVIFYKPLLERQKIDFEIINTIPFYLTGYKNELMQIILIILNNAKDALIHSSQAFPKITIETYLNNSEFMIEITDNGDGIMIDYIDSIFNSHFTTKQTYGGMGIGLYAAKLLVEEEMGGGS